METFLAILLALGIYVVIPVLIGLTICTAAILYDRRYHRNKKVRAIEEAEQLVRETPVKKVKELTKIG